MNNYLESLKWRYATKKYDSQKKVSDKDIENLKSAIQLSVSSGGLQPYRVVVVKSQEMKEKLAEAAFGNNQNVFKDCSHLFIFANEINLGDNHVDKYMQNISETRNVERESLADFENMIKGSLKNRSEEENSHWAGKQSYIALGSLITAAAVAKIDTTPMEGFDPKGVDSILELDKKGLASAAIVAAGYRHSDDDFQSYAKVRKPEEELFITI
ncbi:NAD(P)H-dependent oxidoreductase [Flavobacterium suaedae]|uniref:NAD(P)H-dependent oxidoreductase n=1 Tax=Flavobacterium suaedae TaxID=1767027 RepID=A0ABQ1JWB1_9FLAO|nr:NAD(P)H-dependent oxidoreductase [Flavobacterium suaedae]GGB80108.1 NAD(P)H-dependent oxidoreductase [Flavobacterium suaedae]